MFGYLVHGYVVSNDNYDVYNFVHNFGDSMKILISDDNRDIYVADLIVRSYDAPRLGFSSREYYTYEVTNMVPAEEIEGCIKFVQNPFEIGAGGRMTADDFRNHFDGFFLNTLQKTFGITMQTELMPFSMNDSNEVFFGYFPNTHCTSKENEEVYLLNEFAECGNKTTFRKNLSDLVVESGKEVIGYFTLTEIEYDGIFEKVKKFENDDFTEKVFEDLNNNPVYDFENGETVEIFVKKLKPNRYGVIIAKKHEEKED